MLSHTLLFSGLTTDSVLTPGCSGKIIYEAGGGIKDQLHARQMSLAPYSFSRPILRFDFAFGVEMVRTYSYSELRDSFWKSSRDHVGYQGLNLDVLSCF